MTKHTDIPFANDKPELSVDLVHKEKKSKVKNKRKPNTSYLSKEKSPNSVRHFSFAITDEMKRFCMVNSQTKDPNLMFEYFLATTENINYNNLYTLWAKFCLRDKWGKNNYQK
jgi:hypothetical protein